MLYWKYKCSSSNEHLFLSVAEQTKNVKTFFSEDECFEFIF